MKVLTIRQPYASLIFTPANTRRCSTGCENCAGRMVKGWETRPNPCPPHIIGTRIAIHAAKSTAHAYQPIGGYEMGRDPVELFQLASAPSGCKNLGPLPLGAIIGTAVIARSVPIGHCVALCSVEHVCRLYHETLLHHVPLSRPRDGETEWDLTDQIPYGHWNDGNHAWQLDDPQLLPEPVPFTGGQGWSKTWEPA